MGVSILMLNKINEIERLQIATLLIKAGYTVRMSREKKNGRNYDYSVEYWKETEVEDEN